MSESSKLRQLLLLPREERESPEIVGAIREIIDRDFDALRFYVRWMHFENSLAWHITESESSENDVIARVRRDVIRSKMLRLLSATVGTALIAMLGVHFWTESIRQSVVELKVRPLAGYIEAFDETLSINGERRRHGIIRVGDRIRTLQGGIALQTESGARLVSTGPIDLELMSPNEIRVHEGDFSAEVPPRATGFSVLTSNWKVVDLGTVFGMLVKRDGTSQVHVFKGRVSVGNKLLGQLNLNESQATSVDQSGGIHVIFPADRTPFDRSLAKLNGINHLSGDAVFQHAAPASLTFHGHVSEEAAFVFAEKLHTEIKTDIVVADAATGVYDSRSLPKPKTLRAGQPVSSYLIHGETRSRRVVEGSIEFDGPIVGLAVSAEHLSDTDPQFGLPGVLYPTNQEIDSNWKSRGSLQNENTDRIEILPDGRTLQFRLSCSQAIHAFDQLRVFVGPADDSFERGEPKSLP